MIKGYKSTSFWLISTIFIFPFVEKLEMRFGKRVMGVASNAMGGKLIKVNEKWFEENWLNFWDLMMMMKEVFRENVFNEFS